MNKQNICKDLKPKQIEKLNENDSFKIIFEKQIELQKKLKQLDKINNSNMQEKCLLAIENMFHINVEFAEMMERLPFKHWKKYTEKQLDNWISEEQRIETLFEWIDMLHFMLNIAIVFDFTSDEIIAYYKEKNKENFNRQQRGY